MSDSSNEIRIALDDIDVNPERNTRKDLGDIAEFKVRIKTWGLYGLVQVIKNDDPDGKPYLLENGFRRLTCVHELISEGITKSDTGQDLTHIRAEIAGANMTALDRSELMLALNTSGKSWTPYEQAKQIRVLMDNGVAPEEIESKLGLKTLAIQQRLALLEAPQFLQAALQDGSLDASHARAILRIPNVELQEKLTSEAIEGDLATREIERRAEELVDVAVAAGADAPRRRGKGKTEEEKTDPPAKGERKARASNGSAESTAPSPYKLRSADEILAEVAGFETELGSTTDPVTKAELEGYLAALDWVLNKQAGESHDVPTVAADAPSTEASV